jgi:hypothetical protein
MGCKKYNRTHRLTYAFNGNAIRGNWAVREKGKEIKRQAAMLEDTRWAGRQPCLKILDGQVGSHA